jgi:hypothetical protein
MNTFYRHKEIHKITWAARGYHSIIDYFLGNEKVAKLFDEVRVFRGCDIDTDHFLLLAKIKLTTRWSKLQK